jgi:hypothetical protein
LIPYPIIDVSTVSGGISRWKKRAEKKGGEEKDQYEISLYEIQRSWSLERRGISLRVDYAEVSTTSKERGSAVQCSAVQCKRQYKNGRCGEYNI